MLTIGENIPSTAKQDRARARAVVVVNRLAERIKSTFEPIKSDWQNHRTEIETLSHLGDALASQLYFASGSYENRDPGNKQPTPPQRMRFLKELLPAIQDLSKMSLTHIAYHLFETLIGLLDFDPETVIVEASQIVKAAEQDAIGLEGLAVDKVVAFANRIIANYRDMLASSERCQNALLDLLDVFVKHGWSEETLLTYRLHEIYR